MKSYFLTCENEVSQMTEKRKLSHLIFFAVYQLDKAQVLMTSHDQVQLPKLLPAPAMQPVAPFPALNFPVLATTA